MFRSWRSADDHFNKESGRRCGFRILADTTIRRWHIGSYRYGWEDAGREVERFDDYTFHITGAPPTDRGQ